MPVVQNPEVPIVREGPIQKEPVKGEKPFFPPDITKVFQNELPNYEDVRPSIAIKGTGFETLLLDFRNKTDRLKVKSIKKIKTFGKLFGKSLEKISNEESNIWKTEYGQSVDNIDEKVVPSEIQEGKVVGFVKSQTSKEVENMRLFIHSHSSDRVFSPSDLALFFAGIDSTKLFGEVQEIKHPPIKIQAVSADSGYFLSYVTKDTIVPNKEDAKAEGFFDAKPIHQAELPEFIKQKKQRNISLWNELLEKYGSENLINYIDRKSEKKNVMFPDEVNEKGIDLINMYHVIKLSEKYKLPLYYLSKNTINDEQKDHDFKRITSVEGYYPELTPKKNTAELG